MQTFDRTQFLNSFSEASAGLERAHALGEQLAVQKFSKLQFVGCGAPNRLLAFLQYWVRGMHLNLEIHTSYSAEFVHYPPADLGPDTLVLLASHSGTTADTLEVARIIQDRAYTTLALTQSSDSPLARLTTHALTYGKTEQGYYAALMTLLAFFSSLVHDQPGWALHQPLQASLPAVPEVLADIMEKSHIAYVYAACILMEMQWLHAISLNASEFFHGPLETIDETVPVFVLLDESPNRPEAMRVAEFCKRITPRLKVYDSRDYAMQGIHPELRPLLSPFAADAAMVRFAENLAVVRSHPLSTRRYMGKMEY